MQVRWNTADRAGISATLGPNVEDWYDAAALVSSPALNCEALWLTGPF
jgi:hypothetical protein